MPHREDPSPVGTFAYVVSGIAQANDDARNQVRELLTAIQAIIAEAAGVCEDLADVPDVPQSTLLSGVRTIRQGTSIMKRSLEQILSAISIIEQVMIWLGSIMELVRSVGSVVLLSAFADIQHNSATISLPPLPRLPEPRP